PGFLYAAVGVEDDGGSDSDGWIASQSVKQLLQGAFFGDRVVAHQRDVWRPNAIDGRVICAGKSAVGFETHYLADPGEVAHAFRYILFGPIIDYDNIAIGGKGCEAPLQEVATVIREDENRKLPG